MKIIFNSDLLYATSLIKDNLPRQVNEFLNACLENGHEIVIPLTTLLEFEKKQEGFANKEISTLRNASSKLSSYGINVDDFDPKELVQSPDLIQLISVLGITCNIEQPSYADFENAHRRACTRESPHPPDIKSDEMRDLVIWEIAIRLANDNNGAILMSRDEVHTHYRGDKEASACNLIRCDSFERAFETLNIETKSASLIKSLVNSAWNEIIRSDFPVVDGGQIVSIKSPSFIDTSTGASVASCGVRFDSGDGKDLAASMKIEYMNEQPFRIQLSDIKIDNKTEIKNIELNLGEPDVSDSDVAERLDSLKELMKG